MPLQENCIQIIKNFQGNITEVPTTAPATILLDGQEYPIPETIRQIIFGLHWTGTGRLVEITEDMAFNYEIEHREDLDELKKSFYFFDMGADMINCQTPADSGFRPEGSINQWFYPKKPIELYNFICFGKAGDYYYYFFRLDDLTDDPVVYYIDIEDSYLYEDKAFSVFVKKKLYFMENELLNQLGIK